jgi:hypothetical protein
MGLSFGKSFADNSEVGFLCNQNVPTTTPNNDHSKFLFVKRFWFYPNIYDDKIYWARNFLGIIYRLDLIWIGASEVAVCLYPQLRNISLLGTTDRDTPYLSLSLGTEVERIVSFHKELKSHRFRSETNIFLVSFCKAMWQKHWLHQLTVSGEAGVLPAGPYFGIGRLEFALPNRFNRVDCFLLKHGQAPVSEMTFQYNIG